MEFKLSDWIVNEGNIFELPDSHYYIIHIQNEIRKQLNLRQQIAEINNYDRLKINSVTDFLNVMIDVTKDAGNGSSIKQTLFATFGDSPSLGKILNHEVYKALKNAMLHKYYDKDCKALLPLHYYRLNYDKLITNYLLDWLGKTENDFIEAELRLCTRIEMELKKPVYDRLDYLGVINSFGDNQGSYFKNTMQPIIIERRAYLNEKLNSLSTTIDAPKPTERENKIAAKYYALYHWILIEMGKEKPFEKNQDNHYSKAVIEDFAKNRYPATSHQGFYRAFVFIDLTKKSTIAIDFKKGYKDKLVLISNNDSQIINHLKKYPN